MHVTNRVVTANATSSFISRIRVWTFDSLYDLLMTFAARQFGHLTSARSDVNVVFKPSCREIVRVPETVACFRGVLGDESRRRVTIVAHSYGSMARLHPTIKLVLHDMTIHAGFSIIGHVR